MTSIDNFGFKVFYRCACSVLIICTLIVSFMQCISEHIQCDTDENIPEHVINTFCYHIKTFTVIRYLNESLLQSGVIPYPGVGPMNEAEPIQSHGYYQWVLYVLIIKALLFYFPHYIWKKWEGGTIKALMKSIPNYRASSRDTTDARIKIIKNTYINYIKAYPFWGYQLIFCELLNFILLIIIIYGTNRFLNDHFYTLGIHLIREIFTGKMNVLDFVFPKVTKCLFPKYGPSGTIQSLDVLCVMALNFINNKIFVVLWFGYFIMTIIGFLCITWRLLAMIFRWNIRFNNFAFSLASPLKLNPFDLLTVTQHSTFSDWLFLKYLAKNLEPCLFHGMLVELAKELRQTDDSNDGNEEN